MDNVQAFTSRLIFSTASILRQLSRSSDAIDIDESRWNGREVQKWLDDDKTSPGPTYIASAPISFTMIGLINLADFYITCKATNMTPSDAVAAMQVVTGHSQRTVVAVCIARANSGRMLRGGSDVPAYSFLDRIRKSSKCL